MARLLAAARPAHPGFCGPGVDLPLTDDAVTEDEASSTDDNDNWVECNSGSTPVTPVTSSTPTTRAPLTPSVMIASDEAASTCHSPGRRGHFRARRSQQRQDGHEAASMSVAVRRMGNVAVTLCSAAQDAE